jgi:hypothetical protein
MEDEDKKTALRKGVPYLWLITVNYEYLKLSARCS